jgi:hypothetical protein
MMVEVFPLTVAVVVSPKFCVWMGPGLCYLSWMRVEPLLLEQFVEVTYPPS